MKLVVRPARPADVPAVVSMIHDLAEYERAADQCHITEAQLHAALFTEHPAVYVHVAETSGAVTGGTDGFAEPADGFAEPADGFAESSGKSDVVGFALWFLNFSTWEGVHGIYLEDLYVRPEARRTGAGKALLATLADICVQRGYARLDWWVLRWNPAREFYAAIGAVAMDEWVPYRLTGPALWRLAATAPTDLASGERALTI